VPHSLRAPKVRKYLLEKYGPVCQICLEWKRTGRVTLIDLTIDGGPLSYSVDHKIARADGGPNTKENMQPAHRLCNEVKGSSIDNRLGNMPKMPRRNTAPPQTIIRGSELRYTSASAKLVSA